MLSAVSQIDVFRTTKPPMRATRGRPLTPLDETRPVPRVRFWRERLKLSQADVADILGVSQPQVGRIERGENALELPHAQRLAQAWNLAPTDLLPGGPPTVPLRYRIAARGGGALAAPFERVPAPRHAAEPEDCFAADVADDSADRLNYPRGSTLFVRERAALAKGLARGDKVLVAVFAGTRDGGQVEAGLAGSLTTTALGDILVLTKSSDRGVPPAVVVREAAAAPRMGLAERQAVFVGAETVDYRPREDDTSEILGRIEAAEIPC